MGNHDDKTWAAFRGEMPITKRWAYFDHAAVSPLPEPVRLAVGEWARSMTEDGVANWSTWRKTVETARNHAAALLNAAREEIALVHSTTEGINLVAEGVPWKPGDNIVTLASEFPSNLYPWMNLKDRGVEVRLVPAKDERADLDEIAKACDGRTRVVSVSWVGYATGWRNDLDAIADVAHRAGAKLFVDAIQGLGVFPLDVEKTPVDFLSADGHKWFLGPEGAGIFYCRRQHLDWLRPLGVGWNSVEHAGDFANADFRLKASAGRYEGGTYNMAGIAGLSAALEFLAKHGTPETRAERILDIADRLADEIRNLGGKIASSWDKPRRSGIIAFTAPHDDQERVKKKLREQGIVINCRQGRLRVSPHVYTNADDIEKLASALRGLS